MVRAELTPGIRCLGCTPDPARLRPTPPDRSAGGRLRAAECPRDPRGHPVQHRPRRHHRGSDPGLPTGGRWRPRTRPTGHDRPAHRAAPRPRAARPGLGGRVGRRRPGRGDRAGLRTRANVVVRDPDGDIRAWGSVHDRAEGRMLFVHVVDPALPDDVADACSEVLLTWAVGQAREVGTARGLDVQQIDTGAFADDGASIAGSQRRRVRPGPHLVADEPPGGRRRGRPGARPRPLAARRSHLPAGPPATTPGCRTRPTSGPCTTCSRVRSPTTSTRGRRPSTTSSTGCAWIPVTAGTTGGSPSSGPVPVGALAGSQLETPNGSDGSYVDYVGVLEAARGRGVAKGLLNTIIADAALRGPRPRRSGGRRRLTDRRRGPLRRDGLAYDVRHRVLAP